MKFKNIIVFFLLLPLLALAKPIKTDELKIPINQRSIDEQIVYYSKLYGSDPIVFDVIKNEGWSEKDHCGDSGLSCGIGQYQKSTFERHSKLLGEKLDYYSNHDQIKLITYIFSLNDENLKKEWTAYRCLKNGGKYNFWSKQLGKYFTVYCK